MHRVILPVACISLTLLLGACSSAPDTGPGTEAGLTTDEQRAIYTVGLDLATRALDQDRSPAGVEIFQRALLDLAEQNASDAPEPPTSPEFETEAEQAAYDAGIEAGESIELLDLSVEETGIVNRAISDAAAGTPALDLETWRSSIVDLAQARSRRSLEKELARGKEFLDAAAAEPGAERTNSGLVYIETQPGSGRSPNRMSNVRVHYRGYLADGTEFDSSYRNNKPSEFNVSNVIPCWTEGIRKMKPGGKAKLYCPPDIAYGEGGQPPDIPGNAALEFEVELLAILN